MHGGTSFVRTDREDFTAITRSAALTGIVSDVAVDHDADGQNDELQINVLVNANESHPSLLSAVLSSSDGLYIDAANISIETVPGDHAYTLAFDGNAILESGIDGPYHVTDLKLIDEDNLGQIDTNSETYITAAYSYRSFGPPDNIYLSPTSAGTIAGKSFTNADILSYVKDTNTWDVLYDGSSVNTPKNLGAFAIGNAAYGGKYTGNGTSILRFAPNPAAPGGWAPAEKLTWLAVGATLPAKFAIDGIEMAR